MSREANKQGVIMEVLLVLADQFKEHLIIDIDYNLNFVKRLTC